MLNRIMQSTFLSLSTSLYSINSLCCTVILERVIFKIIIMFWSLIFFHVRSEKYTLYLKRIQFILSAHGMLKKNSLTFVIQSLDKY